MTADMVMTLIVLAFAVILFVFEWVRVDVVGIMMMVLLPLLGLVTPGEAFSGLSSNAVCSIIAVIIIGAGLAGLSAGCYAQMNGYRSRIFEHHSRPGGVAAAWKRGEYLIDGGIHFVMAHKPGTGLHELSRQLGIVPANR